VHSLIENYKEETVNVSQMHLQAMFNTTEADVWYCGIVTVCLALLFDAHNLNLIDSEVI